MMWFLKVLCAILGSYFPCVLSGHSELSASFRDKPILITSELPVFLTPIANLTVPVGREAIFVCRVDKLQSFKVAWLRVDTQTILSIATHVVTKNDRIIVTQGDHQDWVLHIKDIRPSDAGRYMCQVNTEPMMSQSGTLNVVVPPDIVASMSSGDAVTNEFGSAQFRCKATGHPEPAIVWRREDGAPLQLNNNSQVTSWNGSWLNMTDITRHQAGAILCIASNGVPPAVSKRIILQVHFKPSAKSTVKRVDVYPGGSVTLECKIEGAPTPRIYWVKFSANQLQYGDNYKTTSEGSGYRRTSRLHIQMVSEFDQDVYKCIAKNDLGESEASVKLIVLPPTTTTTTTTSTTTTTMATTTAVSTTTTQITTTSESKRKGKSGAKRLTVESQAVKPKNISHSLQDQYNYKDNSATIKPDPWRRKDPVNIGSRTGSAYESSAVIVFCSVIMFDVVSILFSFFYRL